MYQSFISVVGIINAPNELRLVRQFITNTTEVLSQNFQDYEIILVNNILEANPATVLQELAPEIRKHIYIIQLSNQINRNHAIVAGLDRANGDYTLIFELELCEQPQLILSLFQKAKEGFDVVYLKAPDANGNVSSPFRKFFHWILKNYSSLKVDPSAHDSRIISRRALNSLLKLRENLRYMKAIYSIVGYKTGFLETEIPLIPRPYPIKEQFNDSLVAISSFTTFLRAVSLWIFLLSFAFASIVIFNAVKVKLTNVDIFGTYHQALSGWAFTITVIAIFFSITFLQLYILSIFLSNIYQEIKQRPLYLVESVTRI